MTAPEAFAEHAVVQLEPTTPSMQLSGHGAAFHTPGLVTGGEPKHVFTTQLPLEVDQVPLALQAAV